MNGTQENKMVGTWLQGFGFCLGKLAGQLQPGDVIGWNCGYTTTVAQIVRQTDKTIVASLQWTEGVNIKQANRSFRKDRAVAIVTDGKFTVANITKAESTSVISFKP